MRWVAMPACNGVGNAEALARQRAIGAELARHARQEPGGADIRKKADADFRHGKRETIAGNTMRAMHRHADAAAHRNAVDQRDVGLAVILDRGIERIFVAPELQRFIVAARLAEIVKRANVAAGGKGTLACGGDHHPRDRGVVGPAIELRAQRQHHGVRDGIERLRPIERDDAGGAAPLEQNVHLAHGCLN